MARVAAGDTDALGVLLRRHQERVIRTAARLLAGDMAAAEDVVQEVFLRVWRSAGEYAARGNFPAYLLRITRNLCCDVRRRTPPTLPLDDADQRPIDDSALHERWAMAAAFRSALSTLPEEQAEVFVLSHYEGLSYREIADILNCPLGTVASRKFLD